MAVAKARMDTARTVMVVICSRPRYMKSGRKELRAVPHQEQHIGEHLFVVL